MEVLKERGSIDTQTKMHRNVLKNLKEKDKAYRLSAERMRITAILSKKIKIGLRTRSVGAAPTDLVLIPIFIFFERIAVILILSADKR